MRTIFSQVLPDELVARPHKASFNEALWRAGTREFVAHWDGSGVDHELVDEACLREAWNNLDRQFPAASALQSALLNSTLGKLNQTVDNAR